MGLIKVIQEKFSDIKIVEDDIYLVNSNETEIPLFTYDNLDVNKKYEIEIAFLISNGTGNNCYLYAKASELHINLISSSNNVTVSTNVANNSYNIFYGNVSTPCYVKIIIRNSTYFKITYTSNNPAIKISKNNSLMKINEL